jgi:parallel beta-helix repeat protein
VPGDPAAFMSYARFNDVHDDGQLSTFRERLAAEVRAQTGREFVIFQDRADIAWGQNWQQRVDGALDVVTLLLVIVTPGFFGSAACRAEVARFLERERKLGRSDLMLPVYYISAREMDDPTLRESDELARVLASRQFADWREMRFEPFTSPAIRKAIAQLASRMRDTFWHPEPVPARPAERREQREAATAETNRIAAGGQVSAKSEQSTHIVDAWHHGDFTTVGQAIKAAKPGDRILVRPGLYEEAVVLSKPLEILGDGPVSEIVILARGANTFLFQTSVGRVANLTLRQADGQGAWFAVVIAQGRLDLEGCDIASLGSRCVDIRDGADPRLRRNRIHDGKENGVCIRNNALGTLEDNEISGNGNTGVTIMSGANPTLRRNQIHDNPVGVFVSNNGLGTLENNDITSNAREGVVILSGSNTTVRHNRINRNGYAGVRVTDDARGRVEDNDLSGNNGGALVIAEGSKNKVTHARNKSLRKSLAPQRETLPAPDRPVGRGDADPVGEPNWWSVDELYLPDEAPVGQPTASVRGSSPASLSIDLARPAVPSRAIRS